MQKLYIMWKLRKRKWYLVIKCKQSQLSPLEYIYKFLSKNDIDIYNMKVEENINKNNL